MVFLSRNSIYTAEFFLKKELIKLLECRKAIAICEFRFSSYRFITHIKKKPGPNQIEAHCSCPDFKHYNECPHVAASIDLSKFQLGLDTASTRTQVYPVANPEHLNAPEFIRILKNNHVPTEKTEQEIFPKIKKSPFDAIVLEIDLPTFDDESVAIFFHTASKLKSGSLGKFKRKKIKLSEFAELKGTEIMKGLTPLLPYLRKIGYDHRDDGFDSAFIPPTEGHKLIEIIQHNKCFLRNSSTICPEDATTFMKCDMSLTIRTKILIDSSKFLLRLLIQHEGKELARIEELGLLPHSKLALYGNTLCRLENLIPLETLKYLLSCKTLQLDKEDFELYREDILSKIDHRAFGHDYFNLPIENKEAEYNLHLRLPLEGDLIKARIVNSHQQLLPPFKSLTVISEDRRLQIDSSFYELTGNYPDGNGFLEIPIDILHRVIEAANDIGVKVLADKSVIKSAQSFNVNLSYNLNWFELEANFKNGEKVVQLPEILKKLNSDGLIEFTKGETTYIPQKWINRIKKLSERAEYIDGKYVIHKSRALELEELEVETVELKDYLSKIRDFKKLPEISVDKKFQGELRGYQNFSLKWMKFLRDMEIGGILADDMGLGKTVQVAANLQIRKRENGRQKKSSIIVCPKSLLNNWKSELERFTPDLSVEVHEAGAIELTNLNSDILITTYGLLQRNIERFIGHEFDYAVLDEAQAIKNPRSLTAKATFALSAKHRLALSGTPIENHVGELFSIFNFLVPGAYKKDAMNPPIGNSSKIKSLRPFILRRTKDQVLKELPEKVEQTIFCDQTHEEKRQYEELKTFVKASLNKEIEIDGYKKSTFAILEAMTRLRQASCHPGLLNPNLRNIESGKIMVLKEMVKEILEEGHKVIIFSQFTSFLKLVREELGMDDKDSVYLDGSTNNRQDKINDFKESNNRNVFFISLKAGGTGLNLTEASYCFLLDPWWNPAVEDQAIGRLHRMGQKKSVNVYRLISRGSIEEKVQELQKLKNDTIKDLTSDDSEGFIKSLSAKDLNFLML